MAARVDADEPPQESRWGLIIAAEEPRGLSLVPEGG